jgi:hypothetical protein
MYLHFMDLPIAQIGQRISTWAYNRPSHGDPRNVATL